jgi:nitric oxide dioxygenase
MAAIALVVNGLGNPSGTVPVAQGLAKRHVAYGVTRAHYASVGAALPWTLRQGLGEAFTEPVEES